MYLESTEIFEMIFKFIFAQDFHEMHAANRRNKGFSFDFYFYNSNKLLDLYGETLILIIDTDFAIELFAAFAKFFDTLDLLSSTICIN